jgi:prefoldin subunit 5
MSFPGLSEQLIQINERIAIGESYLEIIRDQITELKQLRANLEAVQERVQVVK